MKRVVSCVSQMSHVPGNEFPQIRAVVGHLTHLIFDSLCAVVVCVVFPVMECVIPARFLKLFAKSISCMAKVGEELFIEATESKVPITPPELR